MSESPSQLGEHTSRCQKECQARCCRYLTVQIEAPKNKRDLEEISWWLTHREVSVYVESRRWHLEVRTPCKFLSDENLCVIYEDRPGVCRDYSTEACEYPTRPEHTLQFDSREDFEYWREGKRKAKRRPDSAKSTSGKGVGPASLAKGRRATQDLRESRSRSDRGTSKK